ncbi:hypothetical protein [Terracidiphilus sp.]|uniref:hypothetical protein n=1 Tax=Terracidiphilus sp. TaxID=1964191 RepID=UPI003C1B4EF8
MEWIGGDIDVGSSMVLVGQPAEIAWRNRLFQPNDPLGGSVGAFAAEQKSNGLPRSEATGKKVRRGLTHDGHLGCDGMLRAFSVRETRLSPGSPDSDDMP